MRFSSTTPLFALVLAVGINADFLDAVPRSWLNQRDNSHSTGAVHLGDDGVVRRMELSVPVIARRDEDLQQARWEVRDAFPLPAQEVRRWVEGLGSHYAEHTRRHLDEVFEGIDGRDVHPDEMMNPQDHIRLASPGSLLHARELIMERSSDNMLIKRGCKHDSECHGGLCVIPDMLKTGTCHWPNPPTIHVGHH